MNTPQYCYIAIGLGTYSKEDNQFPGEFQLILRTKHEVGSSKDHDEFTESVILGFEEVILILIMR